MSPSPPLRPRRPGPRNEVAGPFGRERLFRQPLERELILVGKFLLFEVLGSGQVLLVDNQINQSTSSIRLKAEIPNPRHLLWPNQFVNVRLHLTTRTDALVVPSTALQRGPAGTFVYVVGTDATAAVRPVEVALTQGDTAILSSGLEPNEQVVVDGQNQLRPGVKVEAREPGRPSSAGKGNGSNGRSGEGASASAATP